MNSTGIEAVLQKINSVFSVIVLLLHPAPELQMVDTHSDMMLQRNLLRLTTSRDSFKPLAVTLALHHLG